MKLEHCRSAYDYFSRTASSVARQLGFAGIAVIWIFKSDHGGEYRVPDELIWPGLCLLGGLAADFLHYVVGSLIWGGYNRYKEIIGTLEDQDFLAPRWMNWPGNLLFCTKLFLICAAYSLLILFLVDKLRAV